MDIKKLTLGELAKVEELGGASISSLQDESKPKLKMLIALAYVIKKRENPKITLIEVESMPMDELDALIGDIDSPEAEAEGK
jgi:hypothetical protein